MIPLLSRALYNECRSNLTGRQGRQDLPNSKGWAIAPSAHRSGGLRPESASPSQPFGRSSHIAGILPSRLTLIICAAICIAADIAIWRI